jgi:hypothetical protein
MPPRARLAAAAIGCALVLAAARARASNTYLVPGPLFSHSLRSRGNGYGAELSAMHFPSGVFSAASPIGYGGFFQAQATSHSTARFAAGAQIGTVVGAEIGYGVETSHGAWRARHGPQAALFLSAVFVVAALRCDIPLSHEADGAAQPVDVALLLSLKLPLELPSLGLAYVNSPR